MDESITFLLSQGYVVQFTMGIDGTVVQAVYPGNPPFTVIFNPIDDGAFEQALTELIGLVMKADAE